MRLARSFPADQRGTTAAEFALVIGFAMVTVLGIVNGGLMLYSYSNLQMTVENAARWASIRSTVDGSTPSSTALQTAAAGFYKGATATPTFAVTTGDCGMKVTATTTFTLQLGIGAKPLAMSATSCYPLG